MGCQIKRLGQAISDLPLSEFFTTRWRSKLEKSAFLGVPGAQKIRQNDYNLVIRPPIKILRPLFTLQLLILLIKDPCSKKLKHFFIFVLAHKQAIRTSGSIGILYDHLFIGGLVLLRSIHSPYGKWYYELCKMIIEKCMVCGCYSYFLQVYGAWTNTLV